MPSLRYRACANARTVSPGALVLGCLFALLLLGATVTLSAQGTLAGAPELPFGLKWTMTEKEALAALERAGLEPEFVMGGERFTARQVKQIARERGMSQQTVRDAQTWKYYSCGSVQTDSTLPKGRFIIEFLRNRVFRVETYWKTESDEQHLALAEQLRTRYQSFYGTPSVGERSLLPEFPPGQILYGNYAEIGMMPPEEQRRPELFHGWSGRVGENLYGTKVYTTEMTYLTFIQITGPVEKPTGRAR